jgi:glucuronokinase
MGIRTPAGPARFAPLAWWPAATYNAAVVLEVKEAVVQADGIIVQRCPARAGLIGNPSDGFYGKTIALLIHNWAAEVTLWESPELVIQPNPHNDPWQFASLRELHDTALREGYYGGLRLLYGTAKRFYDRCLEIGLLLPQRNFTMRYHTTIPRGVGLAGSSAIIVATLRAMMRFYGVAEEQFQKELMPNLVLSVETQELGLTAGLQDRVIQVYGGAVYMDFAKERMEREGHGLYVPLDLDLFPPLFIGRVRDPSDSSGIHSPVRVRWERGDTEVREAMQCFAAFAEQARGALEGHDWDELGELMNANFDLRRKLYGDEAIGRANLRMIELARNHGAPAKFSGSGGAVIGIYRDDRHFDELSAAFAAQGFALTRARLRPDGDGT